MKRFGHICTIIFAALLFAQSLSAKSRKETGKVAFTATDMVLLYSGTTQSSYWDTEYVRDYVSYTDRSGNSHWLFDGFLLLEIRDFGTGSAEVAFDPGHKDTDGSYLQAAAQADWLKLINYYFSEGHAIDAIEQSVEEVARTLGAPATKRQVIISIPNPIVYKNPIAETGGTTYWGAVNGRVMDFSDEEDQFLACKWYIDRVLERYAGKRYKYVELAGFYWVTEESKTSSRLLNRVSSYLAEKRYSLCWIPYFHAPGYTSWKEKGFSYAYYQPNYFFSIKIPYERLRTACAEAAAAGMDMEVEFDEAALENFGRGSRLRDYMTVFRESGHWAESRLAYYQGQKALRALKYSDNEKDQALYHDFCNFVVTRPCRLPDQKPE